VSARWKPDAIPFILATVSPRNVAETENDCPLGQYGCFSSHGKAQQLENGDHFFKTPALRCCTNSIGADRCRVAQMICFSPLLRFTV
jgi:hypothetical protein